METINKDLILIEDAIFNESIKVNGNIQGKYNLTVNGDIDAWNIDAGDINAGDIDAGDINAWNINARNINARNIDAWNIVCETRNKKRKENKTICKIYIKNRSKLKKKEQEE